MEDFFPGLRASLVDAGAQLMDAGFAQVLTPHGWAAQGETGLPMRSVGRPFLETATASPLRSPTARTSSASASTGPLWTACASAPRTPVTNRSSRRRWS
ncbi:hypothetical protein ABZ345_10965 [Lentzea sp. NPDC005914]|uniref:hypothetical protein n=1 Tax=Lentzea sp. NPDC005914 TaxID=3154572 RepID=UPI003411CD27